jgi:hypothetical protein
VFKVKSGNMMNPISQITMTIFPELANPLHTPRVMSGFPYFSDTQVKNRVIELVSGMFEDEMDERFTQEKLLRFLRENQNNLFNMVEELMTEYDSSEDSDSEDEMQVDLERILGEAIMDIFDENLDLYAWIEANERPLNRLAFLT